MIKLLADVNVKGQVARLAALMQSDYWQDFWGDLDVRLLTFPEVGLDATATDAEVWKCCQQQQLYLLTNNRNDDGEDSLTATLRSCNTPTSLPVFTFGDGERILKSKDYAEAVIESLFDYLLRSDTLRGTGRLFLP